MLRRGLRHRYSVCGFWITLFLVICSLSVPAQTLTTRDYAIEIAATVQESPPAITLNWTSTGSGNFFVQRKLKQAASWETGVTVSSSTRSITDTGVVAGQTYEYSITRLPLSTYAVSGYICVGIKTPLVESRGKVLLLVDHTFTNDLSSELARLQQDLAGDGWVVARRDVNRADTPANIKNIIKNEYNADPANLRTVFLFGHVPVPYSGNYNADDHDDHTGAWAADSYYADMDGTWTDSSVRNTRATRTANRNTPGDGKFDQSYIPSNLELEVGRVDLANLSVFLPLTEKDLLRRYLDKNHGFRHRSFNPQRRALLFDGFGESGGEAYAASGWRNFAPLVSSAKVTELGWDQFFPQVSAQDYLWSYVAGGGDSNYMDCYGVGSSANFASGNIFTVFTMIFGSYFGDWDAPDDFMRAPLASSPYALTSAWAGRPHWFFYHMAQGETIGYSTRLTQNNSGLYHPTNFTRQVHIALMGDPTLRMHIVTPVSAFTVSTSPGRALLTWSASPDTDLQGYHVYRSAAALGPFTRLTASPVSGLSYTNDVGAGTYTYMVRAIKLESSPSGSYYNASQGVFSTVTVTDPVPSTPVNLSEVQWLSGQLRFRCNGQSGQRFAIERSTNLVQWVSVTTNTLSGTSWFYTDSAVAGSNRRFYRTRLVP